MTNNWIFKSFTSKSLNAGEIGFASVQPNYPNIFNWTTNNEVKYNTSAEGPLTITFKRPILVSKYRMLLRRSLRFPRGWNISVSYDEIGFTTIDTRAEDFCRKNYTDSNNGNVDCGELTDRTFSFPRMTIKKIKLILTVPNSCNNYDLHINAFDVYGTTNIKGQCTCKCKRKPHIMLVFVCLIINS